MPLLGGVLIELGFLDREDHTRSCGNDRDRNPLLGRCLGVRFDLASRFLGRACQVLEQGEDEGALQAMPLPVHRTAEPVMRERDVGGRQRN
jgi:hypothetical protein